MKKIICAALCLVCLLAVLALPVSAVSPVTLVDDHGNLFSQEEKARVEDAIKAAVGQSDCEFYVVTHQIPLEVTRDDYRYRYTGAYFLRDFGLTDRDNIVILIITAQGNDYYYDMYTYGDSSSNITSSEADYILDDESVYNAIKGGRLADGACAFLALSTQAYVGRVGVSYWVIAGVSLGIALVIAGFACGAVYASYKQKHKSVDYPLDRFAKMELTHKEDHFAGTFVTKRVIASNSGGSGGSSFHGGGSGHRGGR